MSGFAIQDAVEAMRQTSGLIQDRCPDLLRHEELYQDTLARLRGCHERHRLLQTSEQNNILSHARERAPASQPIMDIRMPQRQEEFAAAVPERANDDAKDSEPSGILGGDDAKSNDPDSIHFTTAGEARMAGYAPCRLCGHMLLQRRGG